MRSASSRRPRICPIRRWARQTRTARPPSRAHGLAAWIASASLGPEDYLRERTGTVARAGRLFRILRDWLAPGPLHPAQDDTCLNTAERQYARLFTWPDALGVKYSDYYRSAYVAIFTLGAAALACAILAVAFTPTKMLFTLTEAALLGGILAIFRAERRGAWHKRWLAYRLLAELFRQMRYLALLGRSMHASSVPPAARIHGGEADWVLKHFQAHVRAAPFARTRLDREWLEQTREHVLRRLVRDQIDYHARNHARCARVDDRLAAWAEAAFVATIVVVLLKILGAAAGIGLLTHNAFGVLAGILPACAAALFAIRHQSEFEMLARKSEVMQHALETAAGRLARTPHGPLASEALGREIHAVALLMLHDLFEWAIIAEVKPVETA
jgi:hypothetical protein